MNFTLFSWLIGAIVAFFLGIFGIGASTAAAADGDAIALINGAPLPKQKLVDAVLESYGVELMQQIVMIELAKQECKRRNLSVNDADIEHEFQDSLDVMAKEAGLTGPDLNDKNKQDTLKLVLTNRRISMTEFRLGMERNAYLRKAASQDFDAKLDDATLREEFARTNGERVIVRHIQIGVQNRNALNQASDMLRNGASFEDIVQRFSENPQSRMRQGEMEPFTFADPNVPAALREAAFALKPDEVSNAIQTDMFFHILKLVRRIPNENVRFEDVKNQVRDKMRERVLLEQMKKLMVELYKKARIEVLDPKLRTHYEEFRKDQARQTTN